MKQISSGDNQLIKLAGKLKLRKYRDSEAMFFVEGKRSVEELMRYPDKIVAVFVDHRIADQPEIQLSSLSETLYEVDSKVMEHICSTDTPQGIAAIARKPAWSLEQMLRGDGLLVLLDRVSDPGNLGSVLRTCWALSADGVLLTRGCVDPFSPKVVRSTMGGILNVPLLQDVDSKEREQLRAAGYRLVGTSGTAARNYFDADLTGRCVLVMGSEAFGIDDELLSQCDELVKIPMASGAESLNVAAAGAIIIAESRRQRISE